MLDILFQERCLGCHTAGGSICPTCITHFRKVDRELPRGIYACYDYRDPVVRNSIWQLKYYKRKHVGSILGTFLYETMLEDISDMKTLSGGKPILVIPIPLSMKRAKERGYNQAKILAENFCHCDSDNFLEPREDLVMKIIDTLPQARITHRSKRISNIKNAFRVSRPDIVRGRNCIVIDDVTTTGATIGEVIRVLKKAGAKSVIGCAVAH